MSSPLLVNSEGFRKKLITRNLQPYNKSPNRPTAPLNYDVQVSDYSVIDSPDNLIDEPTYAKELYKNNQYGADGGYKQVPDPGRLQNTKSNEGEYGYQDAQLLQEGVDATRLWRPLNPYADTTQIFDAAEAIASFEIAQVNNSRGPNAQPYPTFNPSYYLPVNILLSSNPQGSDGRLSQDSYIAKLGSQVLKKEFEVRIGREIKQNTIGRINAFNVRGGTDVLSLLTGRVPLIEPNYRITQPASPVLAATDFALRLAGSTIPVSPIPGSYFDPSINPGQPTTIQQIGAAFKKTGVGQVFSKLLGTDRSGSQLFLDNTGGGQKARLFDNLNYNKYKPGYDRGFLDRLGGALVGGVENNSNYYVGSTNSEPSRVFSPSGDLPLDYQGRELQSPVYGPSELAKLYEGPTTNIKFGTNGPIYSDGGGIEGGFTWISPGTEPNAGKKVGPGGKTFATETDAVQPTFGTTISTDQEFTEGSILYNTQRIIDSAPKTGERRLQHVGNAIDQVSKVFNDGYKEITKGSKVITYVGEIGQERGAEYCRIFTKDTPYLQYNDLQKQDGITISGRKIQSSVLSNTYNLNIYPNKRNGTNDSTNIDNEGFAKKYMFSLENLAWRTSNRPGYTVADLPVCERGPNGGRVMWFAPYGLTFTESSNASWKDTSFIGRPEPVYTYSNTNRSGTLAWKIVVDHPSVLNLIVNKVLENTSDQARINSIIESFFAGCLKYDLYELAKKYPIANPNDLFVLQQEITNKTITEEQLKWVAKDLQTGQASTTNESVDIVEPDIPNFDNIQDGLKGLGFYFYNDIPKPNVAVDSFVTYYNAYIGNKQQYINAAPTTTNPISNSQVVSQVFTDVVEQNYNELNGLLQKVYDGVKNDSIESVNFTLVGTASAPATRAYNRELGQRRNTAVQTYIKSFKPASENLTLGQRLDTRLTFSNSQSLGEETSVTTKGGNGTSINYTCSGDTNQPASKEINTARAMACRRVAISNVTIKPKQPIAQTTTTPKATSQAETTRQNVATYENVTRSVPQTVTNRRFVNNISKRILRILLSECDYFEMIKDDTPMMFDNLKDKLKYFHPSFHSTTPEGLNSRLTFIQQCMRPGDTIPTVKTINGRTTLDYSNATNTAFGVPPVLILRVGDFYNTKIIPESLSLTYEDLDLNPEGIGVQPMIANVQLSFKFVGGSGIKDAVDRLQNALSFNFYANTEVYDDRAETTDKDSLKAIDKEFEELYTPAPPTLNQVENNAGKTNNGAIGDILSSTNNGSGYTGMVSYTKLYNQVIDETQSYFNNVLNKNKEVLSQYNEGVRQIWSLSRNYVNGSVNGSVSQEMLFGKPANFESNLDSIFTSILNDINNNVDEFLVYMGDNKNISNRVLRVLEKNYENYIGTLKNSYFSDISTIIQDFTNQQQDYVKTLTKLNIVTYGNTIPPDYFSGTDGYQENNGKTIVYWTTGTSLNDMITDAGTIQVSLSDFAGLVTTPKLFKVGNTLYSDTLVQPLITTFNPQIPFRSVSQNASFTNSNIQRQYILFNQKVTNSANYESFKDDILSSILNNPSLIKDGVTNLEKVFDDYWIGKMKNLFVQENTIANAFLNYMEKESLVNYLKYTEVTKDVVRELFYSSEPNSSETPLESARIKYINSLGLSNNSNSNPSTFNDNDGGVYIPKIKFN